MSNHTDDFFDYQGDLFEFDQAKTLLDQLLSDSKIYKTGKEYKQLLEFVSRLRNIAPFNAMLLQIQKPGLSYAASAKDWKSRFKREVKEGARPLVILWPFGPVAFVYDVLDTEGYPLPESVSSFLAVGDVDKQLLADFEKILFRKNISFLWVDDGDQKAGLIRVVDRAKAKKDPTTYAIHINRNHSPAVQFSTLAHELGHLFLGHLGPDAALKIPRRRKLEHKQQEIEAESVAFIVCERNGVAVKSESYLSNFIASDTTVDDVDVYQVMRAAGQVETILKLARRTSFTR